MFSPSAAIRLAALASATVISLIPSFALASLLRRSMSNPLNLFWKTRLQLSSSRNQFSAKLPRCESMATVFRYFRLVAIVGGRLCQLTPLQKAGRRSLVLRGGKETGNRLLWQSRLGGQRILGIFNSRR